MSEITITYTFDPSQVQCILDGWDRAQAAVARYNIDFLPTSEMVENNNLLSDMMQELRNNLIDHLLSWAQENKDKA